MGTITDHVLFRALANRNSPIAYDDAVQIFLSLYCTLDVLPEDFPVEELSAETLVEIFEELSAQGLVDRSTEPSSQVAWADLSRAFLSGCITHDESFRERLGTFLLPCSGNEVAQVVDETD